MKIIRWIYSNNICKSSTSIYCKKPFAHTFLEQYGHIDHFRSTALPQFEHNFMSLSLSSGASDHRSGGGGGGKGSGQEIAIPDPNKIPRIEII